MHSLDLSPVVDVFEWTGQDGPGGGLILVESRFRNLGAGAPTTADHPGSQLLHEDDWFRLVGLNVPMDTFSVLTHDTPNHRITLGERTAYLTDLAGSGQSVTISVIPAR